MQEALTLLERYKGLYVTFTHDTCSGTAPYCEIAAGVSLRVQGIMFDHPEAGPEEVTIHLGVDNDPSEDLTVTLAELIEVTNVQELIELASYEATAAYP